MDNANNRASAEDMTALILRIFRVNGALLLAGDRLVSGLGLTSARWQLLGGMADDDGLLTVAQLARKLGTTRQAVQRIANDLVAEGLLAFRANPGHKRAQLLMFTDHGRSVFAKAMAIQQPWVTALGYQMSTGQAAEMSRMIDALLDALR